MKSATPRVENKQKRSLSPNKNLKYKINIIINQHLKGIYRVKHTFITKNLVKGID